MNSVHQNLLNQKQATSSEEVRWETEKQELFSEVVRSNVVLEEKELIAQERLKNLEDGYKTALEVYDQRVRTLDEEKRLIETQSTQMIDMLQSKGKASEKEINDLRNMSIFLVSTIQEREELLSKEAEVMRQEISNM